MHLSNPLVALRSTWMSRMAASLFLLVGPLNWTLRPLSPLLSVPQRWAGSRSLSSRSPSLLMFASCVFVLPVVLPVLYDPEEVVLLTFNLFDGTCKMLDVLLNYVLQFCHSDCAIQKTTALFWTHKIYCNSWKRDLLSWGFFYFVIKGWRTGYLKETMCKDAMGLVFLTFYPLFLKVSKTSVCPVFSQTKEVHVTLQQKCKLELICFNTQCRWNSKLILSAVQKIVKFEMQTFIGHISGN